MNSSNYIGSSGMLRSICLLFCLSFAIAFAKQAVAQQSPVRASNGVATESWDRFKALGVEDSA